MPNKTFLHGDLLFMNVSWTSGDLHLYENQSGFAVSIIYTVINSLILLMAFIVHKAVYKLLTRLPDRAINHIIKPSMVSSATKPDLSFHVQLNFGTNFWVQTGQVGPLDLKWVQSVRVVLKMGSNYGSTL